MHVSLKTHHEPIKSESTTHLFTVPAIKKQQQSNNRKIVKRNIFQRIEVTYDVVEFDDVMRSQSMSRHALRRRMLCVSVARSSNVAPSLIGSSDADFDDVTGVDDVLTSAEGVLSRLMLFSLTLCDGMSDATSCPNLRHQNMTTSYVLFMNKNEMTSYYVSVSHRCKHLAHPLPLIMTRKTFDAAARDASVMLTSRTTCMSLTSTPSSRINCRFPMTSLSRKKNKVAVHASLNN